MTAMRSTSLTLFVSLWACSPAPSKSIDEVWLPAPRDARPPSDLSTGDMGGVEQGGVSLGGDEVAGQRAGAEPGGEAGVPAGGAEVGGSQPPALEARGLPRYESSTLAHVDGEVRLAWTHEGGVWVLSFDALGRPAWERFIPRPEGLSGAQMSSAELTSVVIGDGAWLIASGEGFQHRLWALSEGGDDSPRELPLTGPARVAQVNGRLFVTGVDPIEQVAAWLAIDPSEQVSDPYLGDVKRAPARWPAPDSVGTLSGRAQLRFDQAGQCVTLDGSLELINSNPCLEGEAVFIGDDQTSYLTYVRPGEDALLVNLSHQPDLASSYEVLTLGASDEGLTGHRFPAQPHRRALVGVRLSEEEDGLLRDRLAFVEPDGVWVSEEGWERWPYEQARLITRRGLEGWVFVFNESGPPELNRVPLKVNEFRERLPFGLSVDETCRPSAEVCDQLDNNCDGIVDNGVCCAPFRAPLEAVFRPLGTPSEFYVSDNEDANVSRFIFRTAEDRWEPWGFYYPTTTRGAILISYGLIEGAHEGLGWSAVGDYSALVAKDDDDEWTVFWNHSSGTTALKAPERLGCERALAFGVLGYAPTATSPVVVCDDRLVHVRADLDPVSGGFRANVTHESPFAPYPPLEWATITRHYTRGNSSVAFAFESLSGSWEVSKMALGLSVSELAVQVTTSLTARLGYGGSERPSPVYLHRDEAPGVPGSFPLLQLTSPSDMGEVPTALGYDQARVHLPRPGEVGAEGWRSIQMGGALDQVRYAELQSKVVGARRTGEDEVSFWAVDLDEFSEPNLWSTAPSFVWRSSTGPEGVEQMRWDVIHGDYYNYIAVLSPREGADWAINLYSIRQCRR